MMLTELETLEIANTGKAYATQQKRVAKLQGPEATDQSMAITQAYIDRLIEAVPGAIERLERARGPVRGLRQQLLKLDASLIALAALQGTLHSIAIQSAYMLQLKQLGAILKDELYAAGFTSEHPKAAGKIKAAAMRRKARVNERREFVRKAADRLGYQYADWSQEDLVRAGGWLADLVLSALPDVFMIEGRGDGKTIMITDEADEFAKQMVDELLLARRKRLPMAEPPEHWTGLHHGGFKDRITPEGRILVRARHKDVRTAVKEAAKNGAMAETLSGVNALQAVPWRLNERVLGVIRECVLQGIAVKGLPGTKLPRPKLPKPWDQLTEEEQQAWDWQFAKVRNHNMALKAETLLLAEDLKTAELITERPDLYPHGRFWTPMNMDWRGRVYPLPQFNFQRDDRIRALFLFDQGAPLGDDGLRWLKIHVANTADWKLPNGSKTSKLTMDERVQWVNDNMELIEATAATPLRDTRWTKAGKPFLFLASAFDLVTALTTDTPSSYVSNLPVSWDGSCSGLQHLCAMTRAPEGRLVNLVPGDATAGPADVYATVADLVRTRVTSDLTHPWAAEEEWKREVAKLALEYGIDRDLVKRNVMTFSYSSKKFGMSNQLQEDTMAVLDEEVLTGERKSHPFGEYARGRLNHPSRAARYLAGHVYAAIREVVHLPAEAMGFLQGLAKALAHEGKPLRWTTPTGLPWINRYHEPVLDRIELWMFDRGVRVRQQVLVATGDQREIDKAAAANGVAPNFVHSLDAAHLLRVSNQCRAEQIALATVHDSFGALACHAGRLNHILREQFVAMYEEHDVLAEALASARADLTLHNHKRLPELPAYGDLNLENVNGALYAFA